MKSNVTITVIANMTANYSEGLGNIASVQKVYRNQHIYAIRSRESLKNAIMTESGLYDDLKVSEDGVAQKFVSADVNAATCRALEGGYMNTKVTTADGDKNATYVRKSSFYLTDAIATESFINDARFHNNLHLAMTAAKQEGLNVQQHADKVGLMPYQYEYDKSYKIYSLTIDLTKVGVDENFHTEAQPQEKADRVHALLTAVENLNLVVKGNLDNAEPLFVIGGLSPRRTHYFENVIHLKKGALEITDDVKDKLGNGFSCGLLKGGALTNESEIEALLQPKSITSFFADLKAAVSAYYGV